MNKRRFHKNLNKGCWTMKGSDCPTTHIAQAYLENVTIHQPNLQSKAVRTVRYDGGHRSVFAWFWSSYFVLGTDTFLAIPAEAKRVRYNPRTDDYFHIDGRKVDNLARVWLMPTGKCWAIETLKGD